MTIILDDFHSQLLTLISDKKNYFITVIVLTFVWGQGLWWDASALTEHRRLVYRNWNVWAGVTLKRINERMNDKNRKFH